jgi:hypothetical protein
LRLPSNINQSAQERDSAAEKCPFPKISFHIISVIATTYLVTCVDKTTLGYVALSAIAVSLGTTIMASSRERTVVNALFLHWLLR